MGTPGPHRAWPRCGTVTAFRCSTRAAPTPWLTMAEAATELGISAMTTRRLILQKILPATQPVPYAPWAIHREDLGAGAGRVGRGGEGTGASAAGSIRATGSPSKRGRSSRWQKRAERAEALVERQNTWRRCWERRWPARPRDGDGRPDRTAAGHRPPRVQPLGCHARCTTVGVGPREPRRRGGDRLGPSARRNARPCSSSCTPRFVNLAPGEVYATLLDEGRYLCSERTMYRVLAPHAGLDRRGRAPARRGERGGDPAGGPGDGAWAMPGRMRS